MDTAVCAGRLITLQDNGLVSDEEKEAVSQFLQEFEMLKAGKNLMALAYLMIDSFEASKQLDKGLKQERIGI